MADCVDASHSALGLVIRMGLALVRLLLKGVIPMGLLTKSAYACNGWTRIRPIQLQVLTWRFRSRYLPASCCSAAIPGCLDGALHLSAHCYDVLWQASRSYLKLMLCTCSNESFILSFITFLDLDSTTELFDSPSLSI